MIRLLVALAAVWWQTAAAAANPTEVQIPMRDGKSLAGDLYLPRDHAAGQRYPTVLIQTPYSKNRMRPSFRGVGARGSDTLFTRQDYAFLVTDWRGRFGSADAANPPARPGGSEDGFDTVEWITAQPWSNGKVGSWGPSALGGAQYRTAVAQPPGYACAVPVVMPLNLTYSLYFPGGAMWEEFVRTLARLEPVRPAGEQSGTQRFLATGRPVEPHGGERHRSARAAGGRLVRHLHRSGHRHVRRDHA